MLFHQRLDFSFESDELGSAYRVFRLSSLELEAESLTGEFRKKLCETLPASLPACGVPDFMPQSVTVSANLHHHHGFMGWTQEAFDDAGALVENRVLAYQYILHTNPRMFTGGEIELSDGTSIEPINNRLVLYHPAQIAKIRLVECYSAHPLHGRWSLSGHAYGRIDGWLESIRSLLLPMDSQTADKPLDEDEGPD